MIRSGHLEIDMTAKKYILGAGPTGLLAAVSLHLHGIPTTLIGPQPQKKPSMVLAIHPKNYKYLSSLGISVSHKAVTRMQLNYYKHVLNLNTSSTDREHLCLIISYDELLNALLSMIYTLEIPWIQESVSQITTSNITISNQVLPYDLLLACDGIHSQARQQHQISTKDTHYNQYAFAASISHTKPIDYAYQNFSKIGTLAILPTKNTHKSALIWAIDMEAAKRIEATGLKVELSKATPFLGKIIKLGPISKQPLTGKIASHYTKNNLLLVGSALHHVHPLAGIGFNLAISDIRTITHLLTKNIPYALYTSYRQDAHIKAQLLTEIIGKRSLPNSINSGLGLFGSRLIHNPSIKQTLLTYIDEICLTDLAF